MIVYHVGKNGDIFEGGPTYPGDGMLPIPWFRINGQEVTNEEFVRRWRMQCDHKFVDSRECLKCGWVPPDTEAIYTATITPSEETVISGMHGLVKQWKADYERMKADRDKLRGLVVTLMEQGVVVMDDDQRAEFGL